MAHPNMHNKRDLIDYPSTTTSEKSKFHSNDKSSASSIATSTSRSIYPPITTITYKLNFAHKWEKIHK